MHFYEKCAKMGISEKCQRVMKNAAVVLMNMENNANTQTGCAGFDSVKDYLLSVRGEMDVLSLDEYTYKMVYAPMQSGKTSMLICKGIEQCMSGLNVVIVVRDYKMDMMQIERRLNEMIATIKIKIMNKEIKNGECNVKVLSVSGKNIVRSDDLEEGSVGSVILMMGNNVQYKKLDELMMNTEKKKSCVMYIDEIDVNIKKNESNLGSKLMKCDWNVRQRVGVTATAMGFILSDYHLSSCQLVVLNPNETYKGVEKIDIKEVQDCEDDMYKVYDNIAVTEHKYKGSDKRSHPYIILNKTMRKMDDQNNLMWDMYNRYRQDYVDDKENVNSFIHITVNSSGVRVLSDTVFYKVKKEKRKINGKMEEVFTNSFTAGQEEYEEDDGEYIINEDISSVLQIIKVNLENRKSQDEINSYVINIIGDMCFSRGISVVSRDYKWHITSEYYLSGKTTDCGSILQALRVCGIFNDDINLKLFTTRNIRNHINGYNSLQKKMMEFMCENECSVRFMLERLVVNETEMLLKRGIGRGKNGDNIKIKITNVKGANEEAYFGNKTKEEIKKEIKKLAKDKSDGNMNQGGKGKIFKLDGSKYNLNRVSKK